MSEKQQPAYRAVTHAVHNPDTGDLLCVLYRVEATDRSRLAWEASVAAAAPADEFRAAYLEMAACCDRLEVTQEGGPDMVRGRVRTRPTADNSAAAADRVPGHSEAGEDWSGEWHPDGGTHTDCGGPTGARRTHEAGGTGALLVRCLRCDFRWRYFLPAEEGGKAILTHSGPGAAPLTRGGTATPPRTLKYGDPTGRGDSVLEQLVDLDHAVIVISGRRYRLVAEDDARGRDQAPPP